MNCPGDATLRLFFGVVPDATTREHLAAAAGSMPPADGAKWVPHANFHLTLAFVALTWLPTTSAIAAESVDGTIESLTDSNISIKDKDGKIHSFEVASDAEITLDGKTAKLDTLGVGSSASISTETKNNKSVAVKVRARSKLAKG